MSDLTDKFTTLESQLTAQHDITIETLEMILNRLDLVNTNLDTVIVNNATNTRLILAAIGQSCYCEPGSTPPLVIPPTDPTTRPVNQDKCKRVQAFLHAMQEVFTVLDMVSAVGIGFSPQLFIDAWDQVIASLGNTDETGVMSFPEAAQLMGSLINYVGGNIFVGGTLSGYFAPLIFDLRDAMYSPTTPAATQSAYNGVISGSDVPGYAQNVLIDAAYNALWSYYFDPASTPNLTGYDGFACAGAECITLTSIATSTSCGGAANGIEWEAPFPLQFDNGFGCTSSDALWTEYDFSGWTLTPSANVRVFYNVGSFSDVTAGTPFSPVGFISHVAVIYLSGTLPFTLELCAP